MKSVLFTDIHFGRKQNSDLHNTDCVNFIKFMTSYIRKNNDIDNIIFLGDWFENRSAVNILTLNYSYNAASIINDLGIPVYFIVGNHDLYTRNNRDVFSTIFFHEFNNFNVIQENTVIDNIGDGGILLSPFLFHDEYTHLNKYKHIPVWFGHYEFNGFIVTGDNIKYSGGPDPLNFKKIKRIFSGHFHKRQQSGNITYIGNTFPMDFSDANDNNRGFAVYDHDIDTIEFINWQDCPKYSRVTLSQVLDNNVDILDNARVECIADIDLPYEDTLKLKKAIRDTYNLREFVIKEPIIEHTNISDDSETESIVEEFTYTNELIIKLLSNITSENLDKQLLVDIYKTL